MAPKSDMIGRLLHERYRLTRTVGTGGMGAVYEAMDERLERRVAVKVLRSRSEGALSEARFAREVRASSRLLHPNIVSVFDSGHFSDADGHDRPFLVLEYIEGESLHERLQSTRLSSASIENITTQIARGLAVAHAAHVIHGDLKPHNIMLQTDMDGSERVRLVDFGLAKLLDEVDAGLTQTGVIVGSPRYLSPERLHGDRDDARSDLYALGVILYEMLTGRPPFVAKNTPTLMLLHLTEKPVSPQSICARPIPDALNRLCLALLEKNPDDRPENAEAVAQWVRRAQKPSAVPDLFDLDDEDEDEDDDFGGGTQTTTRTEGLTLADSGAWGGAQEPELPEGEVVLAWCRAPDLVRFYRDDPREARRLDALVTEVTAPSPWGGVIGHTAPGSYFYIFPYMKPALEWALTVQRELLHAAYTESLLERPAFAPVVEGDEVIYRGVRLAVALLRDDTSRRKDRWTGRTRFFGPAVAQVEAWAKRIEPGETAVVGGVDEALCTAMNARSLGVTDEVTQSLYARIVPAELSARAVAETAVNPRAEGPDDGLIGRDGDIKNLAKKLGAARLVSLIGVAGAGKSALARHMATADPRGAVWIELAAAQGRPDIDAAVAAAFGWVGPGQEQRDIVQALASEAPGLVVLDNCEHVLAALVPFVSEVLANNPDVTVMLTSRVPLGLSSEVRHEVAPLSVDAASELFVKLCARQGHPVGPDEHDDVRALVQRLDGLPLAVELAAGRASVLRAKDIAARLDSDMGILRRTGSNTGSGMERQATLDQALEWSWTLLDESERHAFIQCSVFGGGFDLEAAEAVLDLSLVPGAPSVLDLLQSLREKSLLHTQPGPDIRFYVYKTLTSFLQRKGQRETWRPLLDTVERRHARYYIDRGRELWAGRRGLSSKTVLDALTREEENLRRVVDRFAASAPGWALSAAFLLCSLYARRGLGAKRTQLLARIRTWPRSAGDRADYLSHVAEMALVSGDLEEALRAYTLGYVQAQASGDVELCVDFVVGLSRTRFHMLDVAGATEVLDEGAALLDRPGGRHLQSRIQAQRIALNMGQGTFAESARLIVDLLPEVRHSGDVELEMRLSINAGVCFVLDGKPPQAEASYRSALALADALGDEASRGWCLGNLGGVLTASLRTEAAREAFEEAVLIHRKFGSNVLEGTDRGYLAQLDHIDGDYEAARKGFAMAAALLEQHRGRELAMMRLGALVFSIETSTVFTGGKRRLAEARTLLGPLADQPFFGDYLRLIEGAAQMRLHLDAGKVDEAEAWRTEHITRDPLDNPFALYVRLITQRMMVAARA